MSNEIYKLYIYKIIYYKTGTNNYNYQKNKKLINKQKIYYK